MKRYFEVSRNRFFISGMSVFLVLVMAVASLDVSLAADEPSDEPAGSWREAMAALEAQEWPRAAAYFRQVTEKAPESGFPWFRLGQALHGQGDFTGAIHAMMVAAAYSQIPGTASYYLARSNARLGRYEQALQWLERGMQKGFDDLEAMRQEPDLAPFQSDPRFERLLTTSTQRGLRALPEGHPLFATSWHPAADRAAVVTVARLPGGTGGISVAPSGEVYVGDFGSKIFKIRGIDDVEVLRDDMEGASGSTFGPAGELFQANFGGGSISKITPDGEKQELVESGLIAPVGIVRADDGSFYVANCDAHRISKVSPRGEISVYARHRLFYCPNGLDLAPSGDLYVASFFNGTILKVLPGGEVRYLAQLPEGRASYVVYHEGELYVTANSEHRLYHLSPDGVLSVLAGTGVRGTADGPAKQAMFSNPNGLAVSADGKCLLVNDSRGDRREGSNSDGIEPTSALRAVQLEPGADCGGLLTRRAKPEPAI